MLRRRIMIIVSLCLLLLMTACKADDSDKSSQTKGEKDSIQEEKIEQKTNPATVEVDNS
ncbi:hypothetical protein H9636_11590 [Ureibacillus sp. Re31]|uniref:Uncharacterized protein n=1 Tax=Ureibacillus galli TaxID=2762222 RepID=A0ABR8XDJ3_9BACL|nr:hypothetical protein [Ureibacillus galli]MBD8027297.1 hypothetical protein [Ureibacillus galli]